MRKRPRKRNKDGTWRKKRSDTGRKREKVMDNEDDDDIPQEPRYGSIDYVDHCMNNLGMSLNFADPDGTISSKGYKNDNEKQIWQAVLLDYRTLSDAIAALRKDTNEQENKENQG